MLPFLIHFTCLCDTETDVGNIFTSTLLLPLCSILTAAEFACQRSQLLSRVQLFATPWTVVCQASLSMWFSRQEYWKELPFSPPGIEPRSPASAGRFLTTEPPGEFAHFTDLSLQGSSFHSFLQLKEESCFSFVFFLLSHWASLVAQLVRNPPATLETCVWSLGWEDPLEKEMATHSSILA